MSALPGRSLVLRANPCCVYHALAGSRSIVVGEGAQTESSFTVAAVTGSDTSTRQGHMAWHVVTSISGASSGATACRSMSRSDVEALTSGSDGLKGLGLTIPKHI